MIPGNWAVMGSSTAAGVGASTPSNGWAALIGQHYSDRGVTIVNLGLGGSVTYNGLSVSSPPVADRRSSPCPV